MKPRLHGYYGSVSQGDAGTVVLGRLDSSTNAITTHLHSHVKKNHRLGGPAYAGLVVETMEGSATTPETGTLATSSVHLFLEAVQRRLNRLVLVRTRCEQSEEALPMHARGGAVAPLRRSAPDEPERRPVVGLEP